MLCSTVNIHISLHKLHHIYIWFRHNYVCDVRSVMGSRLVINYIVHALSIIEYCIRIYVYHICGNIGGLNGVNSITYKFITIEHYIILFGIENMKSNGSNLIDLSPLVDICHHQSPAIIYCITTCHHLSPIKSFWIHYQLN